MNRIYSYCSYKQSPAGFQLGCADISQEERIHLSKADINEFVQRSFESGMIKYVHGKIPNTDRYIYIIKKMKYTSENEDEYAAIVHMNFAFEFSSYEEYICFARGIGQVSSEELPKLFHSVVLPDAEEDTFALLINGRNLSEIIDKINSLGEAGIGSDESELTYFGLKSKQTGIKEILEMYGNITEINTALFKKGDYEIVLKKRSL